MLLWVRHCVQQILFFPTGCCKPKKIGKHWYKLMKIGFRINNSIFKEIKHVQRWCIGFA